jgi:hypothetical protein
LHDINICHCVARQSTVVARPRWIATAFGLAMTGEARHRERGIGIKARHCERSAAIHVCGMPSWIAALRSR